MGAGLQLDEAQYDPGGYGGTGSGDGYGETPYGGSDYSVWELPVAQPGSDDPTQQDHLLVGELEHRRDGVLIGARVFGDSQHWRLIYDNLNRTQVEGFRTYFNARRFRLLPDVADETTYWLVHWVEGRFAPRSKRGTGVFSLQLTLEEV